MNIVCKRESIFNEKKAEMLQRIIENPVYELTGKEKKRAVQQLLDLLTPGSTVCLEFPDTPEGYKFLGTIWDSTMKPQEG